MVNYQSDLTSVTLIKRYKRFLADVVDDHGNEFTVHCPNTGAMTGCGSPNDRIWLSKSPNLKRKYAFTWELTEAPDGSYICVNTQQANRVVGDSLESGLLNQYFGVSTLRAEQPFPAGHGRADFRVADASDETIFIEVKSCTLAEATTGLFPDTRSVRALKHVESLIETRRAGHRAVMLFAALNSRVTEVRPAFEIDPEYSQALLRAVNEGVEVLAVGCDISPKGLVVTQFIPVELDRV